MAHEQEHEGVPMVELEGVMHPHWGHVFRAPIGITIVERQQVIDHGNLVLIGEQVATDNDGRALYYKKVKKSRRPSW